MTSEELRRANEFRKQCEAGHWVQGMAPNDFYWAAWEVFGKAELDRLLQLSYSKCEPQAQAGVCWAKNFLGR